LRSGCIQILPYRDRAGRPILALVGDMGMTYGARLVFKFILYALYVIDDIESQRKGLVAICWPKPDDNFPTFSFSDSHYQMVKRLIESTSIRFCAIHACIPDTLWFRQLRPFLVRAVSPEVRRRLQFFVATEAQRQYVLQGYGISTEIIPITDTGNVKTVFFRQWIKLRHLLESEFRPNDIGTDDAGNSLSLKNRSSSPTIVQFPGSNDVLYRTGTTTSFHSGNATFRQLIEYKFEEYETGLDVSIPMLADEVINEIQKKQRGRFLKWDTHGYWTVLTDRSQINTKVTASIRDVKRLKDAKKKYPQSIDNNTEFGTDRQHQKRRK